MANNTTRRPIRVLIVLATALACGAAAFSLGNILVGPRKFSIDERRLMWLSGAGPLIASEGDRMVVEPEFTESPVNPAFNARKEPGTYRIFCLGGSTTAGWPFHTASYPRVLASMLKDVLPGRKVEVINAGFESSDSAADARLVERLLDFEPDLLLVYEGRNERWNLPLHRGWRGDFLRMHCRLLLASKAYAALDRLAVRLSGVRDYDEAVRRWTATSGRTPASELHSFLSGNLGRMLFAARRKGCRVMLLTQVASPEELSRNPEIFEINSWLRRFAADNGDMPLADVEKEFRARWDQADRLIIPTPTVHPDLEGDVLIARTAARALENGGLIAPKGEWRLEKALDAAHYIQLLGLDDAEFNRAYDSLGQFFIARGLPEVGQRYLRRVKTAEIPHRP